MTPIVSYGKSDTRIVPLASGNTILLTATDTLILWEIWFNNLEASPSVIELHMGEPSATPKNTLIRRYSVLANSPSESVRGLVLEAGDQLVAKITGALAVNAVLSYSMIER